jgi:hypothetical protein
LIELRSVFRTHAAPFPGGADALAVFRPEEIEKWKELVGRTDFGKGARAR